MSDAPVTIPDPTSKFFDNYLKCLVQASIPEKQRRWYVKRLEEFIKAHNGDKIKDLDCSEITHYFETIGRQKRLAGWQFYQCIDAIRILYCSFLRSNLCNEVDWRYWLDSAKQLDFDHPSTARQFTPEELSYIKSRRGDGALNQIRTDHHDLLVRFTTEVRRRGYSYRTEQSYEQWLCRFIYFCKGDSPTEAGASELRSFLDYLAIKRHVSASTQNQALNALVFFFKQVLGSEVGELEAFARAKRSHTLPVVLGRDEVTALLSQMQGIQKLVASLLYGTGMRLLEGLRLRV